MKIKTLTTIATATLSVLLLLLLFILYQILDIEHDTIRGQEKRFESFKLADELRQSSDDLTRMASTYISTGNRLYENQYFEILDIRNGKRPRPADYTSTYWWLPHDAHLPGARAVPLKELMRRAGFTTHEFDLLQQSQSRSDKLVNMEKEAFAAMEGLFMDSAGNLTVRRTPDPGYARSLLYGESYQVEKASIMAPIQTFLAAVDARTANALQKLERRQLLYVRLALFVVSAAVIGMVSFGFYIRRRIVNPVYQLVGNMEHVTTGKYGVRNREAGNDELSTLARGFNGMAAAVERHTATLAAANLEMTATHKKIADSIDYASLIQTAVLPHRQLARHFGAHYFVLWKPRDVVGGDFYVFHQDGDNFLIGVVDCAGHGVPGALMTMLAHAAISHAIAEVGLHDPAAILGRTDTALRAMLSASHLDSALATHADAALIYVDRAAGHMSFSGAKMSLYICDDGWVEEIKGARRPLAHKRMGEFANTALSLTPGRTYYLVTDGYLDQAGGDEGFCFGNDRFKQALQTHADLPLTEQSDAFAETLARYQRSQPQRDDITIVSFRPI
ncbi:SpoIIE family protein phosphatase [Caballeronia mineralivorans]|jgi:serine phosphatase RsbU (regulator of sigma subunit)|uniref:SpoIIE family protein phosphatase n=1 Tax=Caballeronia mineralivorans TaxID=2010198 RepID=UPI0023EFB694|nr:SpoIIE family protein phosphatase [Caballeronia mineralivorans]MDB5789237.1 Serine phosphatase RsbU, regulator of sigma subunit [Caballeronia mineralivorans]MEA3100393.1 hypothetical protein [Caballeronia mineralivorans]